ncbi:hypothetical protein B0H14DRAFT_3875638 [Mycena olivaceomarginata]|nr:hypothetical protein B0H14DRAFT_3875638 [Mycena olivaceomarginata]
MSLDFDSSVLASLIPRNSPLFELFRAAIHVHGSSTSSPPPGPSASPTHSSSLSTPIQSVPSQPPAKRSRRCFVCGRTRAHRLNYRFCPRTVELINNGLARYSPDGRLMSSDGSPLPMTRNAAHPPSFPTFAYTIHASRAELYPPPRDPNDHGVVSYVDEPALIVSAFVLVPALPSSLHTGSSRTTLTDNSFHSMVHRFP